MQDNVTQADEERVEALWRVHGPWRMGVSSILKRAFAAHRLASTTAQTELVQRLVEALEAARIELVARGCRNNGTMDLVDAALAAHRESQP